MLESFPVERVQIKAARLKDIIGKRKLGPPLERLPEFDSSNPDMTPFRGSRHVVVQANNKADCTFLEMQEGAFYLVHDLTPDAFREELPN